MPQADGQQQRHQRHFQPAAHGVMPGFDDRPQRLLPEVRLPVHPLRHLLLEELQRRRCDGGLQGVAQPQGLPQEQERCRPQGLQLDASMHLCQSHSSKCLKRRSKFALKAAL